MLVTKTVQLDFANQSIRAIDHIQNIRKSAEYASLNLLSRYGVRLQMPMPTPNDTVIVDLMIPEKVAGSFAIGNHLRGISDYLLKHCDNQYQEYLVGKRLLIYTEVSSPDYVPAKIATIDRFEAISDFAKLLERSDEEALDQISRILTILNEAKQ